VRPVTDAWHGESGLLADTLGETAARVCRGRAVPRRALLGHPDLPAGPCVVTLSLFGRARACQAWRTSHSPGWPARSGARPTAARPAAPAGGFAAGRYR